MPSYIADISTPWSQNKLFSYMSDFRNASQWDPGTKSATLQTNEPIHVGTRFLLDVTFAGRTLPTVYEIIEYQPDVRVVLRAEQKAFVSSDVIECTQDGNGSILHYAASLEIKKFPWITNVLAGPVFKRIGQNAERQLRRVLTSDNVA